MRAGAEADGYPRPRVGKNASAEPQDDPPSPTPPTRGVRTRSRAHCWARRSVPAPRKQRFDAKQEGRDLYGKRTVFSSKSSCA